ncbi:MAG: TRAP transporter substrate-binding protein [Chromatiales bacterium]|nr:MAG: TRAP transporter substrate-binding protein [Chromatiales bacterium]
MKVSFPFVFFAALLLVACGGDGTPPPAPGATGTASQVITIGGTSTPNTPGSAMWLQFKSDAEAASQGRLELKPLIYGQLGSEEQLLSGLRRGRIQFANLSAQATSTLAPELSLLYTPYLFRDEAEADYVYDRYLTDIYRELLADVGLHLVTWYEIGFHSVYGREQILTPEQAKGRRFRVSASLNARLFAKAIGADMIPLGYGEIVPSLQTGLIDAGENSISLYARTGISAEAPYLTLTRHVFGMSVIVADLKWWQAQDDATRQILTDTFPSITESRAATRAQDETDLGDPELGIRWQALTPEQRDQWEQATSGVAEQLLEDIGGRSREIYAIILKGKAEYAAQKDGA